MDDQPEMDFALQVAARMADRFDDGPAFLQWGRSALPNIVPEVFQDRTGPDVERTAYWMARSIWNAIPLESNGFKPRPLPSPERNRPCPCGSLKKFKHCCRDIAQMPPIPTELLWPWVVEVQTDTYWLQQAESGVLPFIGIAYVAQRLCEQGSWRSVRKLIEPLLAENRLINDGRLAALVDPLCDAFDALLSTDRNKLSLLNRLAKHPLGPIRAAANQRLASCLHDAGETDRAWDALQMAIRADPQDPANALLEMTILASEGNEKQAQQRAEFWARRLRGDQSVPSEVHSILETIQQDPTQGLRELGRGSVPPTIGVLLDWLDLHRDRPLPVLQWHKLPADADDEWMRDAYEPEPIHAQLESQWRDLSRSSKPFSVAWTSGAEMETWTIADQWLPWLDSHPDALDCFSILDDVVSLLLSVDHFLMGDWAPLVVERGVAMLEQHWPESRTGTLPWLISENRPALRLLAHSIVMGQDQPAAERLQKRLQLYLRLNPNDNHGFRNSLVNLLLRNGDADGALGIIWDYSHDQSPDLVYGRVLALYQLGKRGEAINALQSAAKMLPVVFEYLVRDKAKQPKMDPSGVAQNSVDQAWLYRKAMRSTWLAAEGMQDWLSTLQPKIR